MTREFKRIPLPNPLPDEDIFRAMWIGYEAARFFSFDVRLYLERMLAVGAPVAANSDGVSYFVPVAITPEYEFLNGWHNGFPREVTLDAVAKVLATNPELRRKHQELSHTIKRGSVVTLLPPPKSG